MHSAAQAAHVSMRDVFRMPLVQVYALEHLHLVREGVTCRYAKGGAKRQGTAEGLEVFFRKD